MRIAADHATGVAAGLAAGRRTQKSRAHAGLGRDADLAAHHVDHPLRDREAEAEALFLTGVRATKESFKDAVDLISGDA